MAENVESRNARSPFWFLFTVILATVAALVAFLILASRNLSWTTSEGWPAKVKRRPHRRRPSPLIDGAASIVDLAGGRLDPDAYRIQKDGREGFERDAHSFREDLNHVGGDLWKAAHKLAARAQGASA